MKILCSLLLMTIYSASVFASVLENEASYGSSRQEKDVSRVEHLFDAAKEGDLVQLSKLCAQGVNFDTKSSVGMTPLFFAAYYGHAHILEELLACGADVSTKALLGDLTPYQVAEIAGHKSCQKLLEGHQKDREHHKKGFQKIHLAALFGDLPKLKDLLKSPSLSSQTTSEGLTVLHVAACQDSAACIEFLVLKDFDVATQDKKGWLPIHYGARFGSENTLKALLEYSSTRWDVPVENGAILTHLAACNRNLSALSFILAGTHSQNAQDSQGKVPLHYAARYGSAQTVHLLLENKAWLSNRTHDGSTIVHEAACNDDPACLELFLKRGYSADRYNREGFLPLHSAALYGTPKNVDLLLASGPNKRTKQGSTLLHLASLNRNLQVLSFLLLKEQEHLGPLFDAEEQNPEGLRPMHMAAWLGSLDHVKILHNHGVSLKALTHNGSTVVHMAARNNDPQVLSFFFQHGLALTTNFLGHTALHDAAERGTDEICKLLISKGAASDKATHQGFTVAHLACRNPDVGPLKFFLQRGALSGAEKGLGLELLREAARRGNRGHMQLLQNNNIMLPTNIQDRELLLHNAIENPSVVGLKIFLRNGFSALLAGPDGLLPIERAALSGPPEAVTVLCDYGAPVHVLSKEGETLLHRAVGNPNVGTLELLLGKLVPQTLTPGSINKLEARDDNGRTPLLVAARIGTADHCKTLLKRGADCTVKTNYGLTIIHEAAGNKNSGVLEFFLEECCLRDNIETRDVFGRTPLYFAALKGVASNMLLIFKHMAYIQSDRSYLTSRAYDGSTLLHAAAKNSDSGPLELLLKKGLDGSAQNVSGLTPLHYAAQNGMTEHCLLLLQQGALIKAVTKDGKTPLQLITASRMPECYVAMLSKELEDDVSHIEQASSVFSNVSQKQVAAEKNFISWLGSAAEILKDALPSIQKGETTHEGHGLILFKAHRCIEYSLKAYLVFLGISFDKVHRIDQLLDICKIRDKRMSSFRDDVQKLEPFFNAHYPRKNYSLGAVEGIEYAHKVFSFVKSRVFEPERAMKG